MSKIINRYIWMVIFFVGVLVSVWLEWLATTASPMAWFLLTGVWSAVCGIGFTVSNAFVKSSSARIAGQEPRD